MSTNAANQAVNNAFHVYFNKATPFHPADYFKNVELDRLIDHPMVSHLKPGDVVASVCFGDFNFIMFGTKIGTFVMFEVSYGLIGYRCVNEFYTSASLRGMFAAAGTMRNLEMMERIFAIPESYK